MTQPFVDELVDRAVLALRSSLAQAKTPSIAVFVDPTLKDPIAEDCEVKDALEAGLIERRVLPAIHDDIHPDASPYLLYAKDEAAAEQVVAATVRFAVEELLSRSSVLAATRSICGWIVGEDDPRACAARLSSLARVRRPDGRSWPLRFWDPRVLWQLPRALPDGMWALMRPAIGAWHTWDPSLVFGVVDQGADRKGNRSVGLSLQFGETAWRKLEHIGLINSVLGMAWDWGVLPTLENSARVERLIVHCEMHGFRTEQDALVFAACGLTSSDNFFEHEAVARSLSNAAMKGLGVSEALSKFDDPFWASVSLARPESLPGERNS